MKKYKLPILVAVVFVLAITVMMPCAVMASTNQFSTGYCTQYAAQRFEAVVPYPGVNWYGNACSWYDTATAAGWSGTQNICAPKINSIVVWTGGKDGLGHVAFIESVSSTGISVAEMNVTGLGQVSRATLTWSQIATRFQGIYMVKFKGYIFPERATPPTAPTGVTAAAISRNQIQLQWNHPAYATGFIVERQTIFGTWQQIARYTVNTCATIRVYYDSFLNPNTVYYYRVRAFYNLVGSPSAAVSAKTKP